MRGETSIYLGLGSGHGKKPTWFEKDSEMSSEWGL
jgi:hypothetical protein